MEFSIESLETPALTKAHLGRHRRRSFFCERCEPLYVLGESGGANTHTLTTNEMPSHTHDASGGNFAVLASGTYGLQPSNVPIAQASTTAANGGGQAHNNLQPYVTMNYIIKL